MPTAAKIVAALLMAALAWWISTELVLPNLPEGSSEGSMAKITAIIAFITGWRITGTRVGNGVGRAAGVGMTAAGVLMFWAVGIFSFYRMYERSLDGRYKMPTNAILDIFRIATEYVRDLVSPETGIIILMGCVAIAVIAELTSRVAR